MNLNEFYEIIKDVCPTYHYESENEECPRQVYTEYATNYDFSSNEIYTENISLNLNHYSKEEFDKTVEKLKKVLLKHRDEITFNIETEFDSTTKVITNFFDITLTNEIEEVEDELA